MLGLCRVITWSRHNIDSHDGILFNTNNLQVGWTHGDRGKEWKGKGEQECVVYVQGGRS